ncbi:Ig domain-containing protein [Stenotrophomonas rhizophila]
MAAPFWQAGTLYLPGDLVQPITQPSPNNPQVANGNFAGGATGWTFSGAAGYVATGGYGGGAAARLPGNQPDGVAVNNTQLVVPVGGQLTATSMIARGASSAGRTAGWTEIRWFDGLNTLLQTDKGNVVDDGSGGAWHQSKVIATAPASAAYARAAIHLTSDAGHNDQILGDNLSVSGASAGLPEGLVYKAVQAESGTSGSGEPAWPGILGQQVIDNEVIWEAVTTSRVTWTASPRYVSGSTEPAWPTDIGAMVQDGTINWKAISRRVEDEKCPRTKVVAIVASKVFAVDKDIVKYSATANPLDWSTADDAGYLPTGLQQANSNDMAVLAQYRANLVALNASSFQNWQVDPDPASMAILDQMDGIGSQWQKAAVPVSNDLFYLSQLGVRTVGIANAAENLSAGDVGAPIDTLVQEALRVAVGNGSKVIGTYYPGAGQYWVAFSNYPPPPLGIYGSLPDGVIDQAIDYRYIVAGGIAPYGPVVLTSGALPPGLTLDADGRVHGTLTTAGEYSWTVSVTDADGASASKPDASVVGKAVQHVFKVNLYTGNGIQPRAVPTLDFTNGGTFLVRQRGDDWTRLLSAPAPGAGYMKSFSGAPADNPSTNLITATGVTLNTAALNTLGGNYFGYSFANFPRFASTVSWVGDGNATRDIAHALGVAPGAIMVQPAANAAYIDMYHRSIGETQYLQMNGPQVPVTTATAWGNVAPDAAKFRVGSRYNAAGVTYKALVLAHDTSPDGFIQCGSYVGNGTAAGPTVSLGWQPQMLILKGLTGGANQFCVDTERSPGFSGNDELAYLSVSNVTSSGLNLVELVTGGFRAGSNFSEVNSNGVTYIYVAVRAP